MIAEQQQRLSTLIAGPCVPGEYARDYYGIAWPLVADTAESIERFRQSVRRPADCPNGTISRIELELMMSRQKIVTKKWMAARLGLQQSAFDRLLGHLAAFGVQRQRYEVGAEFVIESFDSDLTQLVPGLRFRTFGNHTAFCERLHAELQRSGLPIGPTDRLFCSVSTRLEEYPRRFAHYFDVITFEPLSTKHSTWLDLRKPLSLPPDRCSKLLYAEETDLLRPLLSGTEDDLTEYTAHLEAGRHA